MIGRLADTSRGRAGGVVLLGACLVRTGYRGMRCGCGVNRMDGIVWTYLGDSELAVSGLYVESTYKIHKNGERCKKERERGEKKRTRRESEDDPINERQGQAGANRKHARRRPQRKKKHGKTGGSVAGKSQMEPRHRPGVPVSEWSR